MASFSSAGCGGCALGAVASRASFLVESADFPGDEDVVLGHASVQLGCGSWVITASAPTTGVGATAGSLTVRLSLYLPGGNVSSPIIVSQSITAVGGVSYALTPIVQGVTGTAGIARVTITANGSVDSLASVGGILNIMAVVQLLNTDFALADPSGALTIGATLPDGQWLLTASASGTVVSSAVTTTNQVNITLSIQHNGDTEASGQVVSTTQNVAVAVCPIAMFANPVLASSSLNNAVTVSLTATRTEQFTYGGLLYLTAVRVA